MIKHVQEKVVKCYIMPLPWLSYSYWSIHFKTSKNFTVPLMSELFHQKVNHYSLWSPFEFSIPNVIVFFMDNRVYRTLVHIWQLVPSEFKDWNTVIILKQLLRNGSQTIAHAGYVKHVQKMLALFKLLFRG